MTRGATLSALKDRFGFHEWGESDSDEEELFVRDFILAPFLEEGWEVVRAARVGTAAGGRATHSLLRRMGEDPEGGLLRVDVVESASRQAAHEQLAYLLGQFQSADVERRTDDAVGEVSFAPPGSQAVAFARANLAVVVASAGARPFGVQDIARPMDERIRSQPGASALMSAVLGDGLTPTGRQGVRLELGGAEVGGEAAGVGPLERDRAVPVRVFREAEEGEIEPPVLRFFARDARFRADSEARGLSWVPRAPGRSRVTVYGETGEGIVSTDSVVVDVA